MAKIMVTGVVLRLTRRSRHAVGPDGMLVQIDHRTTVFVPLAPGETPPSVGATVTAWTTSDCLRDALAQADRKTRPVWRERSGAAPDTQHAERVERARRRDEAARSLQPPALPGESRPLLAHLKRSLLPFWPSAPSETDHDSLNPPKV
jgi:hypothetical protein